MLRARAVAAIAGAAFGQLSFAHHSVLMFDGARGITLEGTVARVLWQNPHALLAVDVIGDDGRPARWTVESESPHVLARLGWTEHGIEAGDRIAVTGAPARDGSRALRCQSVTLADGRTLACWP